MKKSKLILLIFVIILILGGIALFTNLKDRTCLLYTSDAADE